MTPSQILLNKFLFTDWTHTIMDTIRIRTEGQVPRGRVVFLDTIRIKAGDWGLSSNNRKR